MRKVLLFAAAFIMMTGAAFAQVGPAIGPGPQSFAAPPAIGSAVPNAIKGTTIWQSSRNALVNQTLLNPSGTVSGVKVMMGLGSTLTITPTFSGRIRIDIRGFTSNATLADGTRCQIYYGTGVAPSNGAALTGTATTGQDTFAISPIAGGQVPFSVYAEVTGLTKGTAVWVDLPLGILTGGTASEAVVTAVVEEF